MKKNDLLRIYSQGERDFHGHILKNCRFRDIELPGLGLSECHIENVVFTNVDLTEADFKNSVLRDVRFMGSTLTRCDFEGATLLGVKINRCLSRSKTVFSRTFCRNTSFQASNLYQGEFFGGDFEGVSFRYSNLTETDFEHANLRDADFRKTILCDAMLWDSENLHLSKFEQVLVNEGTHFPHQFFVEISNHGDFEKYRSFPE